LLPAYFIKNPAALGAVAGAGNSDADTLGGLVKDTAVGGTIGGIAGVAGKAIQKGADKLGQEILNRTLSSNGPIKSVAQNALAGGAGGAALGAMPGVSELDPMKALQGAVAGGATGAALGAKVGAANNTMVKFYEKTGSDKVGSLIAGSPAGAATQAVGNAAQANIGSSAPAREVGGDVLNWVKNVMGMDTPAGEQNLPQSFRSKMEADATAVRDGLKDGRPSPDVPNIVKEGGNEFLITPSGRRVQLN